MKYLLDTNVCVRYLNRRSPALVQRVISTPKDEIVVSTVTQGEMIAAIALANSLILVTHNTGEFSRIPGLQLEEREI